MIVQVINGTDKALIVDSTKRMYIQYPHLIKQQILNEIQTLHKFFIKVNHYFPHFGANLLKEFCV